MNTVNELSTVTETITPEIAKTYLRLNNRNNRKISPKVVEDYARQMLRGEFRLTHQGIGFLNDGTLGDGQHRLLSIIKSGCTVRMMVTRGLSRDDLLAIDRGRTRSVTDAFHISGVGDAMNKQLSATLSQLVVNGFNGKLKLNAHDILRVYDAFRPQASYLFENVISKACGKGCQATVFAAAIAAMYCGVDGDVIRRFFEVYTRGDVTGCDGLNVAAPINWHRQVDMARAKHTSINRAKMYLAVQNAIYHFANNTGVTTIRVPEAPRYSVRTRIEAALK